jgi:hypothetical protein
MAPRTKQASLDATLDPSSRAEACGIETPATSGRARAELATAPGRSESTWMLLCGMGCALGGLALAMGPRVSWKMAQISEGVADLGVHSGVLIMGGMVLAAIGLLLRAQAAANSASGRREDTLILEQAATDLLQTRKATDEMDRRLDRLCERVEELHGVIEERRTVQPEPTPVKDGAQQEAMFRLAASLDQVGARIEQRLKVQYGSLQERLEKVGEAIVAAHDSLENLLGGERLDATLQTECADGAGECEPALDTGTTAWSADTGETNPEAAPAPAERASLGILDHLHDERPEQASTTDEQRDGTEGPQPAGEPEFGAMADTAAPLPHTDPEVELTRTKLQQLSSLLSDEQLRSALERMRLPG